MNTKNNVIIFSVDRNVSFSVNNAARSDAEDALVKLGVSYQIAEGVYKGVKETSFVVTLPNFTDSLYADAVTVIERLVTEHDQECYMFVDSNGLASLIYLGGGGVKTLGKIKEVSYADALQRDAYTKLDGRYFVAE